MNDEKLKRAKEVFIRGFCNLDFLKDDDEWKEYNVPYEIVLKWAKEDIEFEFDEISKALKFNEQLLEKRKKISGICVIVLDTFSTKYLDIT